jgi:MATE family multidrug resistance protein
MYCIWFNAEAILLFLHQDPEVASLAALYLRWVSLGLPGKSTTLPLREYYFYTIFSFSIYFQLDQPV